MSGAMQQNIKRDTLKKHFKVGPNYTDYERRMINLASMGNSRLARIERRERKRREKEEEEKEEVERRMKESYAQHMQQWHMHQSQAQQWLWWAGMAAAATAAASLVRTWDLGKPFYKNMCFFHFWHVFLTPAGQMGNAWSWRHPDAGQGPMMI